MLRKKNDNYNKIVSTVSKINKYKRYNYGQSGSLFISSFS
jgi:hypothetical protein